MRSCIGPLQAAAAATAVVSFGLGRGSAVRVPSAHTSTPKLTYEGAFVISTPDKLAAVALSPDGAILAVSHPDQDDQGRYVDKVSLVDTWHPRRSRVVFIADEVHAVAWSPDGKCLAICAGSGLTVLRALDPWFQTRTVQTLPFDLTAPVLFSANGDWILAQNATIGDQGFACIRFNKLPGFESTLLNLPNMLSTSLIRYPGNRIALVGSGIAVDRRGKTYKVKPTGSVGLYTVHSNPISGGRWFVAFDMDTVSRRDANVAEVAGTRAWLEDVLTGRRIRLTWPKQMRVNWVHAFGKSSFCVQVDDETLLSGPRDRFRRYRLDWLVK